MMRIWRILDAVAGTVALAGMLGSAPASAVSKPPAAAAQLQVWVGHWNTKGESGGTPWHADTRCAWSPNHEFVVCDQLINDRVNQLMILTYDESAKVYRISSIGKDRAPILSRGTIRGKVWTNTGEFDQAGKRILIRTTVDFSVPHHYADREWTSEDGGAHWSETSRGQAIQVGPGP
jgi:hypothetical protein